MGCPSATAPPLTFTFSGSASSIFAELSTTDENASFSSTRSTSSIFLPAFASAFSPAFAGLRAGYARPRPDRADPLEPAPARDLLARHDQRRRAVVHARRIPRRRRPLRVEHRLQRREPLVGRVAPRPVVDGEVADRDDLVLELPIVDRLHRALVRSQRPAVLVLARDPELAGHE